jgi:integrase/recombinase XerD
MPTRSIDSTKILTADEIRRVLDSLHRKGKRSINSRMNGVIFRLSTCCGLRVSEIVGLKLANVRLDSAKPHIFVPAAIAKRKKHRTVPMWDAGTLEVLRAWKQLRREQGASDSDPFVCSQAQGKHHKTGAASFGKPLSKRNAQARFDNAVKILGTERAAQLSIHSGRHSFCSHALHAGVSLAEVRDAAGHANISTTSIYTHVVGNDRKAFNLFGSAEAAK